MTIAMHRFPRLAAQHLAPAVRGRFSQGGLHLISAQRLPTDSIGTFVLTLTNLVVGSAIRVETQAGALIEFRTAAATSEAFNVPVFSPGSPANDLRIKVRKGSSAPFYIPFETLATGLVGAQSIFVNQVLD